MILGGGMTGLAAGMVSGLPVYEAADTPGGICSSYYLAPCPESPFEAASLGPPKDPSDAYRFEIGGGHWIFGGDPEVLQLIESLVELRRFERRSAVYFPAEDRFVPYPLQYHLRFLGEETARRALAEMTEAEGQCRTLREWLRKYFGETLCALFFEPFHELYTAGYYTRIAPQDAYKLPVDLASARAGVSGQATAAGYNVVFRYPSRGLDCLATRLAERCDIYYGRRAIKIDVESRRVHFADGSSESYSRLVSTLPLVKALELTRIVTRAPADPYSSVLVLNIGAETGPRHPGHHWLYVPRSRAGFHRVGFYSNVDPGFLPRFARQAGDRTCLYVEKSFVERPGAEEVARYSEDVICELQDWGFIGAAEVVHPTWIDVAYTWSWPGSTWVEEALTRLEEQGVHQVGRYARWSFQGIADSIRDGLAVGTTGA